MCLIDQIGNNVVLLECWMIKNWNKTSHQAWINPLFTPTSASELTEKQNFEKELSVNISLTSFLEIQK